MDHLLFFYGKECSHCKLMEGLVQKLVEEGIVVKHLEVENDKANEEYLLSLDKESCGGVPFFVNTQTGKTICGEVPYPELKEWAIGK